LARAERAIAETRWDVNASELKAKAEHCRRLAAETTDKKGADAMRGLADLCDAAFAAMATRTDEVPTRRPVYEDA
jgi:hypothetical protein